MAREPSRGRIVLFPSPAQRGKEKQACCCDVICMCGAMEAVADGAVVAGEVVGGGRGDVTVRALGLACSCGAGGGTAGGGLKLRAVLSHPSTHCRHGEEFRC